MSSIGRRAFARILLLASVLVFAGACDDNPPTLAPGTPQRTLSVDPTAYYVIRNVESGKVLDVEEAGCCNGYSVHQWTYGGRTNQHWRIVDVGGGYYKVVARHSGRVLDVSNRSTSDGAKIHQWSYDGSFNQQWSFHDTGSSYIIAARHSGKVLTVYVDPNAYINWIGLDGIVIRQYTSTGRTAQQWQLERV